MVQAKELLQNSQEMGKKANLKNGELRQHLCMKFGLEINGSLAGETSDIRTRICRV